MIPWSLFNLTPRDQASDWIRLLNVSRGVSTGLTTDSFDFLLEKERLFIITHFGVEAQGVLQQPNRGHVTSLDPTTASAPPHDRSFYFPFTFQLNALDYTGTFQTPMYTPVQPGHILRVLISWTGPSAVNSAIISFGGYSVPKGNMSA